MDLPEESEAVESVRDRRNVINGAGYVGIDRLCDRNSGDVGGTETIATERDTIGKVAERMA